MQAKTTVPTPQNSIKLKEVPMVKAGANQLIVRMDAAALNHKDLFIRRHLYPAISFEHALLGDGYGIVVEAGAGADQNLLNKPVLINPLVSWESDPTGPENGAIISIGASTLTDIGCAQDYLLIDQGHVVAAPAHLTPVEGAALPLAGLTAWRALVSKSDNARPGRNILVTGIGGGVALQVLQFGVALGCNVYVTSGDAAKIEKAKAMGAKGGVVYKQDDWDKQLSTLLPDDRPYIDAVIDGAGGNLISKVVKLLKSGGIISQYGMTVSPKMEWPMPAVLKNIELRGSTLGSKRELQEMVKFVSDHEIRPIVSRVVKGLGNLDGIESLFKDMDAGKQFGKLVIEINDHPSTSKL